MKYNKFVTPHFGGIFFQIFVDPPPQKNGGEKIKIYFFLIPQKLRGKFILTPPPKKKNPKKIETKDLFLIPLKLRGKPFLGLAQLCKIFHDKHKDSIYKHNPVV